MVKYKIIGFLVSTVLILTAYFLGKMHGYTALLLVLMFLVSTVLFVRMSNKSVAIQESVTMHDVVLPANWQEHFLRGLQGVIKVKEVKSQTGSELVLKTKISGQSVGELIDITYQAEDKQVNVISKSIFKEAKVHGGANAKNIRAVETVFHKITEG